MALQMSGFPFLKGWQDFQGKRSRDRILDVNRDVNQRVKNFKWLCDTLPTEDLYRFIENDYSPCFYSIYEFFLTNVYDAMNASIKNSSKDHVKDSNLVALQIQILQVILYEKVHQRWQANALRLLTSAFLTANHHSALRLFIGWYCVLRENSTELEHRMFESLVDEGSDEAPKQLTNLLLTVNETMDAFKSNEALMQTFFPYMLQQIKVIHIPKLFPLSTTLPETRNELCQSAFMSWIVSFLEKWRILQSNDQTKAFERYCCTYLLSNELEFCLEMFRQACMSKLLKPKPLLKTFECAELILTYELKHTNDSQKKTHDYVRKFIKCSTLPTYRVSKHN